MVRPQHPTRLILRPIVSNVNSCRGSHRSVDGKVGMSICTRNQRMSGESAASNPCASRWQQGLTISSATSKPHPGDGAWIEAEHPTTTRSIRHNESRMFVWCVCVLLHTTYNAGASRQSGLLWCKKMDRLMNGH